MARGKVEINPQYCKGCGLCVNACRFGVLGSSADTNAMGYHFITALAPEKCVGCCQCAVLCPEGAIEVYRETEK